MKTLRHWIDGRDIQGHQMIDGVSPSSGSALCQIPIGGRSEVSAAVAAARNALGSWRDLSVQDRAVFVVKMADWLVEQYGEEGEDTALKKLISDEVGKPLPEADIEVIESSDFLRFFAERAPEELSDAEPKLDNDLWPSKRAIISYEPVGVVGIIKPWNYPLEMIAWSLGPALVAGNTCVIKPSERSSLTADVFREMALAVGLPSGVLNIVYGDSTTGQALALHDDVDMVSFTGSQRAGRFVARACADRLARSSLELSGNDAAIVLADADTDLVSNGLVWGAYCNAGQVCVGVKRAYVASEIYDELVAKIVAKTNALKLGSDYGPIINEVQLKSIENFVEDATTKGAEILAGGSRIGDSLYFAPTVLSEIPDDARILQEECFGPLLPIIRVDGTAEAIKLANASDYGLGASIWSSDVEKATALARKLNVGMVWINDVNIALPQAPWAGLKQSGVGFELSAESIKEYTARRHVCVETETETDRVWWYPYE